MTHRSHTPAPPSTVRLDDLDPAAAELARRALPPDATWRQFGVSYVLAVASMCGTDALRSALPLQTPALDFYRRQDIEAIERAADAVSIDLDAPLWRACWGYYSAAASDEGDAL